MKTFNTLILSLVITFTLASTAQAGFRYHADVNFNDTNAQALVVNDRGYPLVCQGSARGRTASGEFLYSYMNQVVLYPGQHAYVYIYTNRFNPFVNVQSDIHCNSL